MLKEVTATSRMSFKQPAGNQDVFYTFEYSETHTVPDTMSADEVNSFKKKLWDTVNGEIDKQYQEIRDLYKK